jgi:hypothetical integral membrane protein (TIGR02206 family)
MISNFDTFGVVHLISIFIPILIVGTFIYMYYKYPSKVNKYSLLLAISIVLIRSVRYGFDIYYGVFNPLDLLSLHVCHINLMLLVICLIKPNQKIFVFTFLIGIPTALMVALFPGSNHPEPGLMRAIFFIMSHTMLVGSSIYLLVVNNFSITRKNLYTYYLISLVTIIVVYIYNIVFDSNFMYLISGPKGTILEILYNTFGSLGYVIAIYLILCSLFTILYQVYLIIKKML